MLNSFDVYANQSARQLCYKYPHTNLYVAVYDTNDSIKKIILSVISFADANQINFNFTCFGHFEG